MNRIINMVIRILILRLTQKGINGAMDYFSNRSQKPGDNDRFNDEFAQGFEDDRIEEQYSQEQFDTSRNARQLRRMARFHRR